MNAPFLTINDDGELELRDSSNTTILTGLVAVRAAVLARPTDSWLMCSSSIDFPREYTTDAATIAFCEAFNT